MGGGGAVFNSKMNSPAVMFLRKVRESQVDVAIHKLIFFIQRVSDLYDHPHRYVQKTIKSLELLDDALQDVAFENGRKYDRYDNIQGALHERVSLEDAMICAKFIHEYIRIYLHEYGKDSLEHNFDRLQNIYLKYWIDFMKSQPKSLQ